MARCRARKAEARQTLDVGEGCEIDAGEGCVNPRCRTTVATERLDGVAEAGAAAVKLRPGVPHLEGGRRPAQRSIQCGELISIVARQFTLERSAEVVAVAGITHPLDDVKLA